MHLSNNLVLKKVIVICISLIFSGTVTATDYFFSSSGDDINNTGLSESSPWATIQKVNSTFSKLKAGDRILFKRGEVFNGALKLSAGGISGNPIVISSYGSGAKPVITGLSVLSSWNDEGNGIYSKVVTCQSDPEIVIIDGNQVPRGRWPNSRVWPEAASWNYIDSYAEGNSITDSELNSTNINWAGAQLVIRNSTLNRISQYLITEHSGNTVYVSGYDSAYPWDKDWGYFIQNHLKTLDTFGEWYFDKNKSVFYMYFGGDKPDNHMVQLSTIDNLISFTALKPYITIDNITIYGANNSGVICSYNNYVTLQNCVIQSCGSYGITAGRSTYLNIKNCTIDRCYDNAIFTYSNCDYMYFGYNTVTNTGIVPGMGHGMWQSGKSIYPTQSNDLIIEYNKVLNSGYTGINCTGNNTVIRYNFINIYGFIKEDCAGIQYGSRDSYKNLTISNNIVINGLGKSSGKPEGHPDLTGGIYLDYFSSGGFKILNNVVANTSWNGIMISGSQNVEISDNLSYNSFRCLLLQELTGLGSPPRNITLTRNIFFAKSPGNYPAFFHSTTNDFDRFGYFDNNFYARPADNTKPILPSVNWSGNPISLEEWQKLYGQDLNSGISQVRVSDTSDIDFYYNATRENITYNIPGPMVDVTGNKYTDKITLSPFTGIILIVDPSPDQPVVPVFLGAIIQDASPSVIEISFNTLLSSDPAPPAGAFSVKVNESVRNVILVTISGTKILLTLASPVKYGDKINISFSQPETGKLQTSKGTVAENIISQTVKNNLTSSIPENHPPSISIKYETVVNSGFVFEIDATGTLDPDYDEMKYNWIVPESVPVSGTTESMISFLAPVVLTPENVKFRLSVTDGKLTESKEIQIKIMPYRPEFRSVKVSKTEASNYSQSYFPNNATDGTLASRWSSEGDNQWIQMNLPAPCKISHLQVAFLTEKECESYFDIYASKDNMDWEPVLLNCASCDFSGNWQIFNFPETNNNTMYSFVKLICHGNSSDNWNNISEFKIFGPYNETDSKSFYNSGEITIYPNPVCRLIKVLIQEPSSVSQSLRIYNSSGTLCMDKILDPGTNFFQVYVTLKPGIYVAKILKSGFITHTQKLIVVQS